MTLLKPTDPDDYGGRLNYACQLGHSAFVEQVVKECGLTNMDLPDRHGSHPLYNAAMKNDNPKLLEWLLDRGASVDLKTQEDGESAFFIAAYNNHTGCMKLLLKRGAKPGEPQGYYGDTAAHVAVRNNFPDVLAVALDAGANVNERNKMKETPLFLACKLNREPLVYSLLVHKANPRLADRDGKDCSYIASEKKHTNCVALLKAAAEGPAALLQEWQKVGKRHQLKKEEEEEKKNRPSWDEIAFQKELKELGITPEEHKRRQEAKAKPQPIPKQEEKKVKRTPRTQDPTKPRPLFDSDEDSDEREERWEKERLENERIAKELKRRHAGYRSDAGGTSFNTGAYMRPDGRATAASSAAQTAAALAAKRAPRDDSRGRSADADSPADEKRSGSRSRAADAGDASQGRSGSRTKQMSSSTLARKPSGKRATRADIR